MTSQTGANRGSQVWFALVVALIAFTAYRVGQRDAKEEAIHNRWSFELESQRRADLMARQATTDREECEKYLGALFAPAGPIHASRAQPFIYSQCADPDSQTRQRLRAP
jgi:hypothetical protein